MNEIPHESMEISQEEVSFWRKEIEASEKFQKEQFLTRIEYQRNIQYFEGIQSKTGTDINALAILDEFSPAVSSVVANTYYQNPSVNVKAKHPASEKPVQPPLLYMIQNPDFVPFTMVDLMGGAIREQMRRVGMKDEMQLAVFDLIMAGFACVESNHLSIPIEQPKEPEAEVETGLLDKVVGFVKDAVTNRGKTDKEIEENLARERGYEAIGFESASYVKRWDPRHILFDSRASCFKESRFIAKIVHKSVGEFCAMYPKHKDKITSNHTFDMEFGSDKSDAERKGVTLYEVQVKKSDGLDVLVLCRGISDAVDYYRLPFRTNGFTVKYRALDRYGKIYPMSRAKKAKKSQDQLNDLATHMMEHTMKQNRKIAVFEGGLTESGKLNVRSGDPYALVYKNVPGAVFEAMPQPATTQDNPFLQNSYRDSINKSIGVSELSKMGQSKNDTLGQDQLENQAFQIQSSLLQDAVKEIANDVIDTQKDIIMQLADEEFFFSVTGIKGGQFWYSPDMGPIPDLVMGDFLVEVDITTAEKPNPVTDNQKSIAYAQFMTNPQTLQFMMALNKRPSIGVIEAAVKSFGRNPEIDIEDIQQAPATPPMQEPAPGELPPPEAGGAEIVEDQNAVLPV